MIDIRHAGDQEKWNAILQFSSQCNRDGNEDEQFNCKQHSSVEQRKKYSEGKDGFTEETSFPSRPGKAHSQTFWHN